MSPNFKFGGDNRPKVSRADLPLETDKGTPAEKKLLGDIKAAQDEVLEEIGENFEASSGLIRIIDRGLGRNTYTAYEGHGSISTFLKKHKVAITPQALRLQDYIAGYRKLKKLPDSDTGLKKEI